MARQIWLERRLTLPSEIIGRKIIGGLVLEFINQPAVAQGAVSHVGHTQFPRSLDETIRLVQGLKSRIFRLNGINLGNYKWESVPRSMLKKKKGWGRISLELALRSVAAEHSERPMYFVFPAFRSSSSAGIDSSRGVPVEVFISRRNNSTDGETHLDQSDEDSRGLVQNQVSQWYLRCTLWCERPSSWHSHRHRRHRNHILRRLVTRDALERGGPRRCVQHTEDLVAHVIFPDKISQEFLIDTSFVDNLPQPSTFCATTDKRKRLDSPPCPKRCIPAQLLSAAPVQPRRDWDGFLNHSSDPLPRSRGKGRENLQRGVSWPWWLNSKELPEHVRDRWPALSWWQRSPDWIDANARDRDPQIPCCCPVRA